MSGQRENGRQIAWTTGSPPEPSNLSVIEH